MNKSYIIILIILLIINSCAKPCENPVGPQVNDKSNSYGKIEILNETWIADFDNQNTYYKMIVDGGVTNWITFKSNDGTSIVETPISLAFPLPIHYYISPGSSVDMDNPDAGINGLCSTLVESNNGYQRFEYWIMDEPSGDWEWFSLNIDWINGPVDLSEFGNAFMITVRGDGKLDIIFNMVEAENSFNETFDLTKNWTTLILFFPTDVDWSQCTGIQLGPPDPSGLIGVRGGVDFDNLKFVTAVIKR